MPMHSSSLQTRMSLNAGSREMGRSRPPLVTISGTERMNSTPLALIAAMMDEPLSSIVSSPSVSKSASMRDLRPTPMRIIAPSTPGGAADMFGRLLCDHFSEVFHERCFVENRAGAGGLIGMAAAAQAAPDGYTLTTSSIAYNVIAPAVSPNPGFDPIKDFSHIAYIGGPPNVLVVNPPLNGHSLSELVALGRGGGAVR